MLTLYLRSDGVTPVEDLAVTGLEPGADSDPLELVAVNESGAELRNVLLVMRTESPTAAGVGLASGVPPQDERWGRLRVIGYDDAGEPGWSTPSTTYRSIGANSGLLIPSIPDGCSIDIDFKLRPPGSAVEGETWRFYLLAIGDEYSQPLATGLGDVSRGIIRGKTSAVIRGCEVTATGTPDDEIHVAAGLYELEGGALLGRITSDHTLNQSDVAAAALASGQSYLAAVTLGSAGTVTITKGAKGASPTRPTPPAGSLLLAWVTVQYDAGGSEIETADIEPVTAAYGRHLAVAGTGLEVAIYGGQSLSRTSWTYRSDVVEVPLDPSTTSYLWLLTSGLWEETTTETPPEEDARLYWEVDTDGSTVTGLVDRRTYAGEEVVLRLRSGTISATGDLAQLLSEHDELVIEQVVGWVSDNGIGGSAGQTILDVEIDGTTIYTSSATEDLRPTFAFDATGADLIHRTGVHQVSTLRRGSIVTLVGVEYPDSDTDPPAWAEVLLICRRPR